MRSYFILFLVQSFLVFSSLFAGGIQVGSDNPLAVRQVIQEGDKVLLKVQVINKGFPAYRCICPETSFSNMVGENNGNFTIETTRDFVQSNYPQLLQDSSFLPNKYQNNGEIVLLYDTELELVSSGMGKVDAVRVASGSFAEGQYTYARSDAYRLDVPMGARLLENNADQSTAIAADDKKKDEQIVAKKDNSSKKPAGNPSKKKTPIKDKKISPMQTKEYSLGDSNPAVITGGVISGEKVVLSVQLVNHGLPTMRCICVENQFAAYVKENNGAFKVYTTKEWMQANLGDVLTDPAKLKTEFDQDASIRAISGKLNLYFSGDRKFVYARADNIKVVQGTYTRAAEDAFSLSEVNEFKTKEPHTGSGSATKTIDGRAIVAKVKLSDSHGAGLRAIDRREEWSTLYLQVVNQEFAMPKCICPQASFASDVHQEQGNFAVEVKTALLDKLFPEFKNNGNLLIEKWQNNQTVYVATGELLLTKEQGDDEVIPFMTSANVFEANYTKDERDANEFEGVFTVSDQDEPTGEAGEDASVFFDGLTQ